MAMSKVVLVKGKGVLNQNNTIDQRKLLQMYSKGFEFLFNSKTPQEGLQQLFKSSDKVGIKINTIGGKKISTRPEVSHSLSNLLVGSGILERNLIIWDRTNRELRDAGYRLRTNRNDLKVHGTDTQVLWGGYNPELISHLNIGSRFSRIQSNFVNSSISLAILKDHGMAGVTAGMKNYFGAIHNPNKYHDTNCDPYVAELFETEFIKKKHKLSILDCLVVQYHRGPSYHPRWAKNSETLIFGTDAVATDFIGWQVIDQLRSENGIPSLKEENREPKYLRTAEKMGLGNANLKNITLIQEEI
jgi:uncharacterized protein (DUF362 family)